MTDFGKQVAEIVSHFLKRQAMYVQLIEKKINNLKPRAVPIP